MAIIYTYPPVTDPDGTELIVVSETKNKNSTRLISLAGICDFCDETSCDHSFRYVTTSSGIPAEAVGCNDGLELISSDATIDITNTGNIIDFKGASGCPTTYVVKPVTCNPDTSECIISNKTQYWIYTCDETLGALAPGYINNFTITGVHPYHPSGPGSETNCFWIEEANYNATSTTCEECCCVLEGVYSYLRCECSEGEWPAWSIGGTLIPEL